MSLVEEARQLNKPTLSYLLNVFDKEMQSPISLWIADPLTHIFIHCVI